MSSTIDLEEFSDRMMEFVDIVRSRAVQQLSARQVYTLAAGLVSKEYRVNFLDLPNDFCNLCLMKMLKKDADSVRNSAEPCIAQVRNTHSADYFNAFVQIMVAKMHEYPVAIVTTEEEAAALSDTDEFTSVIHCVGDLEGERKLHRASKGSSKKAGLLYWKECQFCHKFLTENERRRCGRCKAAWYCNEECSHGDWAEHKKLCVRV